MKIINANYEDIARIDCSCCDDDHTVRIKKSKFFDPKVEDDEYLWFEFDSDKSWPYPHLKERIRRIKEFLKDENYDVGILMNGPQAFELYSLLLDNYGKFIPCLNPEIKFNPEKIFDNSPWLKKRKFLPGFKKIYRSDTENKYYTVQFIFGPKPPDKYDHSSLVFKMECYGEKDWDPTRLYYMDFELGYFLPKGFPDKHEKRRTAKEFLFKKSRHYFQHYEIGVTEKMLVDFLKVLNYMVNHSDKDEHGNYIQCTV
jgi:hypothetical protein